MPSYRSFSGFLLGCLGCLFSSPSLAVFILKLTFFHGWYDLIPMCACVCVCVSNIGLCLLLPWELPKTSLVNLYVNLHLYPYIAVYFTLTSFTSVAYKNPTILYSLCLLHSVCLLPNTWVDENSSESLDIWWWIP